jgi:hypothetical protein
MQSLLSSDGVFDQTLTSLTAAAAAPDVDDLHTGQLAVSIANEALGEHIVGARVGAIAVLGLSMAVVDTEDARPLRTRYNTAGRR